jgi:hypothetical protein
VTLRSVSVQPFPPPESGFPFTRALVSVKAEVHAKKTGRTTRETRQYVASEPPGARPPDGWADAVQGHWAAVESGNHYRRDVFLKEDAIRSRNPNVCGSLALLGNAAHFLLMTAAPLVPMPAAMEVLARCPAKAVALARAPRPRLRMPKGFEDG